MAVDLYIWLRILSNSIIPWINIICDMIEQPRREVYIKIYPVNSVELPFNNQIEECIILRNTYSKTLAKKNKIDKH